MSDVDPVVEALRGGKLAVLPTDTVYGLVCTAEREEPCIGLYRLKGRDAIQPTAVAFTSVDALLASIPELDGRPATIARALLPGPFTLVVPNPSHRFAWLTVGRPETLGVRVPVLPAGAATIVERLGAIVATSANLAGGPDPRRLSEVPAQILDGVAAVVDGGDLPGISSTVIDITLPEPAILREGAGDPGTVLRRIAALHTQCLPRRDDLFTQEA